MEYTANMLPDPDGFNERATAFPYSNGRVTSQVFLLKCQYIASLEVNLFGATWIFECACRHYNVHVATCTLL